MDGHPARPEIDQSLNHWRKIVRIASSDTRPVCHCWATSGWVRVTILKATG